MSLQQFSNQSRPVQTSMLAMLPTESLLNIIGAINDNPDGYQVAEGFDHLSQTCSRMYDLARPFFFHANGFKQFYLSVRVANVAMMDRCEYYNAAPIDAMWRYLPLSPLQAPRLQTTVDLLLSGVNEDVGSSEDEHQTRIRDKKRDKIFNALEWLLKRGANGETARWVGLNTERDRVMKPLGHMNTNLLDQMQRGISKRAMEFIFSMIKMLSSHGFPNPTRTDTFFLFGSVVDKLRWHGDNPRDYFLMSPLKTALKSHVIPSVLELMLSEHADRGIKLRDWYDECPASLVRLATREYLSGMSSIQWSEFTSIDKLIDILHADLHKEYTRWEENYFGEVGDIFKQKLKLMIEYEMIDASEEALLKSIEAALYSIAADGMRAGHYDKEYFKTSWGKLGDAVRPFATDVNLAVDPETQLTSNHRVHRFYIHPEWNPWESWFRRQDKARHERWLSGNLAEGEVCPRHNLFGHSVEYGRASSLGVPEWHTVSMDEWYASFPRSE
ncbi:hypothetical protein ACHAP8_008870 [Fusarium lateritium]